MPRYLLMSFIYKHSLFVKLYVKASPEWGKLSPKVTDGGQVFRDTPLTGDHRNAAPNQALRGRLSVYALRAAFGGCAPTRACGRSPEGEAFFLASCPKLRYNRENYVSRKDDTDGKRRYF